jgi:hypothetical protein
MAGYQLLGDPVPSLYQGNARTRALVTPEQVPRRVLGATFANTDRVIILAYVERLTFSGKYATWRGQRILYITERAVSELDGDGLRPIEIAPGIDLERDILTKMACVPRIGEEVSIMDPLLFSDS